MKTAISIFRAVLLALALSVFGSNSVFATIGGTSSDAWDISVGGTVITNSTGFLFATPACGLPMFGGTCSPEGGSALFSDFRPAGFVHFVEWQTTSAATIRSFNLSAAHDSHGSPAPAGQCDLPTFRRDAMHRGFSHFTLKAFNPGTNQFDIILYDYAVPLGDDDAVHPGEGAMLYDPDGNLSSLKHLLDITDNVLQEVSTNRWRAEFTQVGCPSNESGPRILELDGFTDPIFTDADDDGIPDSSDNCPAVFNPGQEDNDGDGLGDVCDDDDDNDGILDLADNCPTDPNPLQEDFDLDGLGNACDATFDGGPIISAIEDLVLEMRQIILLEDPPGGAGMISKLTGKGGILQKVGNAVSAFEAGLIDQETYVEELQAALDKVTAFDNQLAAKAGNGQISPAAAAALAADSAEIRAIIDSLLAAVS